MHVLHGSVGDSLEDFTFFPIRQPTQLLLCLGHLYKLEKNICCKRNLYRSLYLTSKKKLAYEIHAYTVVIQYFAKIPILG